MWSFPCCPKILVYRLMWTLGAVIRNNQSLPAYPQSEYLGIFYRAAPYILRMRCHNVSAMTRIYSYMQLSSIARKFFETWYSNRQPDCNYILVMLSVLRCGWQRCSKLRKTILIKIMTKWLTAPFRFWSVRGGYFFVSDLMCNRCVIANSFTLFFKLFG